MINPVATFWRASVDVPERESLVGPGGRFTVAQSWEKIRLLAGLLAVQPSSRGARVVFLGANSEYHFWLWLGCEWVGDVFVPLSSRLSSHEAERIFRDCTPSLVVLGRELVESEEQLRAAYRRAGLSGKVLTLSELEAQLATAVPLSWRLPGGRGEGGEPVKVGKALPAGERERDETSVIVYTSGTSGCARGACHTRETMWWAWQNYRDCFDYSNLDTVCALAPLSHIGGFNGTTNDIFSRGGKVVVVEKFSPLQTARLLREERVNIGFAVPTMFVAMLRALQEAGELVPGQAVFPDWRRPLIGGAPLPASLVAPLRAAKIFPVHVWGMTETGGAGCCLGACYSLDYPGSAGRPFTYSDLAIVDEQGREIYTANTPGQVVISGPHVVEHYWPAQPVERIGSRLATGDIAYWDEEGRIWFQGRASDTINTGGEKVQPVEVEQALSGLPGLGDGAIVGLKDDYWGQKVVLATTGNVSLEQVRTHLTGLLSGYKIPKEVHYLPALPLNPSGKVDRKEIVRLLSEA